MAGFCPFITPKFKMTKKTPHRFQRFSLEGIFLSSTGPEELTLSLRCFRFSLFYTKSEKIFPQSGLCPHWGFPSAPPTPGADLGGFLRNLWVLWVLGVWEDQSWVGSVCVGSSGFPRWNSGGCRSLAAAQPGTKGGGIACFDSCSSPAALPSLCPWGWEVLPQH